MVSYLKGARMILKEVMGPKLALIPFLMQLRISNLDKFSARFPVRDYLLVRSW